TKGISIVNSEGLKANTSAISGTSQPEKAFQHGVVRRLVEGAMFFRDGEKTFFDSESFPWVSAEKAEENCARCPETVRVLQRIPGMKSAMFSILAPRKHIPEHRGMYKGVLRYHLGLIVPGSEGSCRIRVGNDVRCWKEGKSLIFDDSHPHEVWNDCGSYR